MSAPNTNIDKQKRRHRGPLIGMALVVIFALALTVFWLLDEAATADNPQGGNAQIDGSGPRPDTPAAAQSSDTTP